MIRKLHTLLLPWGNAKSVREAPREIVKDLLSQERLLEQQLTGSVRPSLGVWLRPLLAVMAFVGVVVAFSFTDALYSAGGSGASLQTALYSVLHRIRHATPTDQLVMIAVVPWTIAALILFTAMRR